MAPRLPTRRTPGLPDVFEGEIYQSVGKYARGAVLYAFEQIGGPDSLARWASDNPDDFYTKLFPKIIARESEVHHTRGVDELMDAIDGDYAEIAPETGEPRELDFENGAAYPPTTADDDDPVFDMDDFDIEGLAELGE